MILAGKWRPYELQQGSTVTGELWQWPGVGDPHHSARTLLAWLPPSYTTQPQRRYPVIYFHDGQNVFDHATSFSGEWQADETLTTLAAQGLEAIAIGVPHAEERRFHEYSPVSNPKVAFQGGGGADQYVAFLAETVKALVDITLRTVPAADQTFVIGSSMGGVVSLHAVLTRPEVFGHAGVLSPAFWTGEGFSLQLARRCPAPPGRLWLDVGGREDEDPQQAQAYWQDAADLAAVLLPAMGQRLRFVTEPQAIHHETAWAARLPGALRFLLTGA